MSWEWKLAVGFFVAMGAIGAILFSYAPAFPHDFYDPKCCSGQDCRPAADGDVVWTQTGWEVKSMKETVPFSSSRLRVTPIGEPPFHECVWHGMLTCLYVPEPQS